MMNAQIRDKEIIIKKDRKVSWALTFLQVSVNSKRRVSSSCSLMVIEMSFKDDLESLGYVMVHMMTG
jgi:hypothetical protein